MTKKRVMTEKVVLFDNPEKALKEIDDMKDCKYRVVRQFSPIAFLDWYIKQLEEKLSRD